MSDSDTERRSLSRGERAAVVLAVVVVAAALWVWRRKPESAHGPALQPASEAAPPQAVAPEEAPTAVTDAQARPQLQSVSDDPAFLRWLAAAGDIVRRWAIVTDNLAQGVSPRKQLEPAAPRGRFQVVDRGGKTFIAPESYARYDEFARAVASIKAPAFAAVYKALRPAVQMAYRALGYPTGSLDAATLRALRRIEGAPVVDGDLELTPERGVYLLADPKLEGLSEVDKHLVRMGPRNARAIQAKAREIREALALPAEAAK